MTWQYNGSYSFVSFLLKKKLKSNTQEKSLLNSQNIMLSNKIYFNLFYTVSLERMGRQ